MTAAQRENDKQPVDVPDLPVDVLGRLGHLHHRFGQEQLGNLDRILLLKHLLHFLGGILALVRHEFGLPLVGQDQGLLLLLVYDIDDVVINVNG